jgi:hypothetical protein
VSTWAWVITGYVLVFVAMGAFAVRTITKGRELAREVPDEDKPWT